MTATEQQRDSSSGVAAHGPKKKRDKNRDGLRRAIKLKSRLP
jgi:hypothetical protein